VREEKDQEEKKRDKNKKSKRKRSIKDLSRGENEGGLPRGKGPQDDPAHRRKTARVRGGGDAWSLPGLANNRKKKGEAQKS